MDNHAMACMDHPANYLTKPEMQTHLDVGQCWHDNQAARCIAAAHHELLAQQPLPSSPPEQDHSKDLAIAYFHAAIAQQTKRDNTPSMLVLLNPLITINARLAASSK